MSEETVRRLNGLRPYTITLSAGVPKSFNVNGDWIQVMTAPVSDLLGRFDESQQCPLPAGFGMRTYYGKVELYSATGQTVTVLLGYGNAIDSRATLNATVNSTVAPGASLFDGGDVSVISGAATLLLAQDTARSYANITNSSTNTVTVRIGTSSVAAATGTPLEPGCTLPLSTTAAIYAFQASGSAVSISAAAVRV